MIERVALIFPEEYLPAYNYFRPFITEKADDTWKNVQFVVNPKIGKFDAVVVLQSTKPLEQSFKLHCPLTKTLLVLQEPPDILFLPEAYTRQFHCTLGQDQRVRSKVRLFTSSGHHWFVEVGINNSDVINFPKNKIISAVVSNKTDTEGHRKRLHFMQELKKYFGDQLDWFGRGIKELDESKLSGLKNYKYHVVLENSRCNDYWTEKLADAFVAHCFPFYCGAPNIYQYFQPDELKLINVDNIESSIKIIEAAIKNNLYEASQSQITNARCRIFTTYHPFQIYLDSLYKLPDSPPSEISIKPHNHFKYDFNTRWKMRIKHYLNI